MEFTTIKFILNAIVEYIDFLVKEGKQGTSIEKTYGGGYISVDHEKERQTDIANLKKGLEKVRNGTLKSSDKCFTDVTIAVQSAYSKAHPKSKKTNDDIVCALLDKYPL